MSLRVLKNPREGILQGPRKGPLFRFRSRSSPSRRDPSACAQTRRYFSESWAIVARIGGRADGRRGVRVGTPDLPPERIQRANLMGMSGIAVSGGDGAGDFVGLAVMLEMGSREVAPFATGWLGRSPRFPGISQALEGWGSSRVSFEPELNRVTGCTARVGDGRQWPTLPVLSPVAWSCGGIYRALFWQWRKGQGRP